jgi:hypothetical protein
MLEDEDTLSPEAETPVESSARREGYYLMAMSGPFLGEKYSIGRSSAVIGRAPSAEISLLDRTASRQHAEVIKERGRILVRDLSSRNGLFVNNLKVDQWVLRDGDLIRIGGTLLQFVEAASAQSFFVGKYRHKVSKQREHRRFTLIAVGDGYLTKERKAIAIISIKDISREGIGLFTKVKPKVGAEIRIAIYFKNPENLMVAESVLGTVVSCTDWRGGTCIVSIRFHEPISKSSSPGLDARLAELERIS